MASSASGDDLRVGQDALDRGAWGDARAALSRAAEAGAGPLAWEGLAEAT